MVALISREAQLNRQLEAQPHNWLVQNSWPEAQLELRHQLGSSNRASKQGSVALPPKVQRSVQNSALAFKLPALEVS